MTRSRRRSYWRATKTDPAALPADVQARRTAAELPYQEQMLRSEVRRARRAAEPKTLGALVSWVRWAYHQEPPVRLHSREIGPDGLPRWTGDFLAWVQGIDGGVACAQDDDGYYRTPLRCALYSIHGRFAGTDSSRMALFLMDVAASEDAILAVAQRHGIGPDWTVDIVAEAALRKLWAAYTPRTVNEA